jgi:hypothetical protein
MTYLKWMCVLIAVTVAYYWFAISSCEAPAIPDRPGLQWGLCIGPFGLLLFAAVLLGLAGGWLWTLVRQGWKAAKPIRVLLIWVILASYLAIGLAINDPAASRTAGWLVLSILVGLWQLAPAHWKTRDPNIAAPPSNPPKNTDRSEFELGQRQ